MPGAHVPIEIKLHQKSRVMEISFSDGRSFRLPYEFLRVYSPSAEVRGHGPGQEVLQTGKREVEIRVLEPVGSYAVQPVRSEEHTSLQSRLHLVCRLLLEKNNDIHFSRHFAVFI